MNIIVEGYANDSPWITRVHDRSSSITCSVFIAVSQTYEMSVFVNRDRRYVCPTRAIGSPIGRRIVEFDIPIVCTIEIDITTRAIQGTAAASTRDVVRDT